MISKIFQIVDKTFFKERLRAANSMISNLFQNTKTFSKLAIKQPTLWCLYYDIRTWFYVFDKKSKIFDGVFLRKVSNFSYKQNTVYNCFAMKELYHNFTWKLPKVLVELFFKIPLKKLQEIRTCSKSATKMRVEPFLKSVAEYAFSKTWGLFSEQHSRFLRTHFNIV